MEFPSSNEPFTRAALVEALTGTGALPRPVLQNIVTYLDISPEPLRDLVWRNFAALSDVPRNGDRIYGHFFAPMVEALIQDKKNTPSEALDNLIKAVRNTYKSHPQHFERREDAEATLLDFGVFIPEPVVPLRREDNDDDLDCLPDDIFPPSTSPFGTTLAAHLAQLRCVRCNSSHLIAHPD